MSLGNSQTTQLYEVKNEQDIKESAFVLNPGRLDGGHGKCRGAKLCKL